MQKIHLRETKIRNDRKNSTEFQVTAMLKTEVKKVETISNALLFKDENRKQ